MIAVIFELTPHEDRTDDYFDLAGKLHHLLDEIDGFISIERFESRTIPGRYLSLSFWRDEEAVRQWRNLPVHRATQAKGRKSIFESYRLRVADVVRDYGLNERETAPDDSRDFHV
jgi:heme-degrading monooxygenase HmoA